MIKTIYFIIILNVLLAGNFLAQPFSPPIPEPGTAIIDGSYGEWNLTDDFFANMYEAGNDSKDLFSKCYLRYDCSTQTLFVLVLVESGVTADLSAGDAWVKIYDIANSVQVDGNSANFAWLTSNAGYEASFTLAEGNYSEVEVHINVTYDGAGGRTSSTGKKDNYIQLEIDCGVLPVELSSFGVTINNNIAQLNWETATEVNNYGFEIQRSSEANNWDKVGFVAGHGNSNSPKFYSFNDQTVARSGSYAYRLKQIDIDGKYEFSDVVNITLNVSDLSYKLDQNYPNPFNPSTTINYTIPKQDYVEITIYNIFGEEVARLVNEVKESGTHSILFNAENLASGMYYYKIETESYVATKKLLLLK
jgi:hypothetical protein